MKPVTNELTGLIIAAAAFYPDLFPLSLNFSASPPVQGGGFEAYPTVSLFGCLLNKPFPCCMLDVSVTVFAGHWTDEFGFHYSLFQAPLSRLPVDITGSLLCTHVAFGTSSTFLEL